MRNIFDKMKIHVILLVFNFDMTAPYSFWMGGGSYIRLLADLRRVQESRPESNQSVTLSRSWTLGLGTRGQTVVADIYRRQNQMNYRVPLHRLRTGRIGLRVTE
jgi:hypothetical protein